MFLFDDDLLMVKRRRSSGDGRPEITVTGGTITPFNRAGVDYVEIFFNQSGSINIQGEVDARYALAGGGASGSTNNGGNVFPGGSSAGQLSQGSSVLSGHHDLTIGQGGAPQNNNLAHGNAGQSSVWQGPGLSLSAQGGLRGGSYFAQATVADYRGANGPNASGGMGSGTGYPGGTGERAGGNGVTSATVAQRAGGGGAGAGSAGGNATPGQGGAGGDGVMLEWAAEPKYVCAGAGGVGAVCGAPGRGGEASPSIRGAGPTLPAFLGSASGSITGDTDQRTSGPGGNGFAVIVIRADAARVVAAPIPDADFSAVSIAGSSSSDYSGPEFSAMLTSFGSNAILEGRAGERVEQICARIGSHPWALDFPDNTIPASGSVNVIVGGGTPPSSSFLKAFAGSVAGVPGTVAWVPGDNVLRFTRTRSGAAVVLDESAPFIPSIAETVRIHPICLWLGKNNLTSGILPNSGEYIARMHDEVVAWLRPIQKRAIVFGQFCNTGTPATGSASRARINTCNSLLAATYGQAFIDVVAWMRDPQTWVRMGLTPTPQDEAEMTLMNLPPSLARDSMHFSDAAESDLHNNVTRARMIELGWFVPPSNQNPSL